MTEFKDIKQAIVAAQLSATPKEQMINSIMEGSAELLSANDIIKKLGITADEFSELLLKLPNHYLRVNGGLGEAVMRTRALFDRDVELINRDLEQKSTFPKPDLYVLGKARWTKETFKKWLEEQCQ